MYSLVLILALVQKHVLHLTVFLAQYMEICFPIVGHGKCVYSAIKHCSPFRKTSYLYKIKDKMFGRFRKLFYFCTDKN